MLTSAFAGLVFAVLVMTIVWVVATRIHNAGLVDVAWTASFTGLVWIYLVAAGHWSLRGWLIAGMTTIWSVRLTAYLWQRVAGEHPREDSRYAEIRREWASRGLDVDWRFFWFFQGQAVAAALFSAPMLLATANPEPGLRPVEWLGLLVWAAGVAGEAMADAQLRRFKADPANRGRTCQVGLWRYSRHPNYFFEWIVWVGFAVFALGSPWGWAALYCPLAMLYILLFVTGIPAAEAASLRSRGDEYREYQRTTSAFVPWFRRSS